MSRYVSLDAINRAAGSGDLNGIRVVDPGVPLTDFFDGRNYGPIWRAQPAVRRVTGFIARHVASLPVNLYRKTSDGRVKVGGHDRKGADLARLLAMPTTEVGITRYRLFESLILDGLLHDFYVGVLVTEKETGRVAIRRIPARKVRIRGSSLGVIEEVLVETKGDLKPLDPASLILDVGYSERGVGGTSPVVTLHEVLQAGAEAVKYRRQMFQRGARIGGVIERPLDAKWSDLSASRFREDWRRYEGDGEGAGGTPVLEDGMTYKSVQAFRPKDTDDLASRKLTAEEVASMYYVPPELLGIREGTFSNVRAFVEQLYGPTLGPYIESFEQTLNATLLRYFGLDPWEFYIEANVEAKLRGSFEQQASIMSTATGRPWMLTSEARDRMNLPHIDGTDELVTPLNVLVGGQASPQDGGEATPTDEPAIAPLEEPSS